jgi:outer membrane protein OmpA-like peptidoglycan-associated protein
LNALVNNPLARIAIDSPFKASMTKDEIITREPADAQVAFRGVIGFLTDDSTLSDDDIMAISVAAKIVVDYDRYFFYRGRSVTYEVTVTGSYSIRGNRESNQVLALNRAVSVEEALTAALEVAATLTVTGKSAQDILYGGAISRAIIEEPAGASRGRTNNKALDRTATIDIVARDENGDILMPRDF